MAGISRISRTALFLAAVAATLVVVHEAVTASGLARVRSNDPAFRTLIQDAIRRSPTFNRLVRSIDETDGIVYVDPGRCARGARACLALSVIVAGPHRILRVLVDPRRGPEWEVIGLIGHELRHALEVLGDPKITTDQAMFFLFSKENDALYRNTVFETPAAIVAGNAVMSELRRESRMVAAGAAGGTAADVATIAQAEPADE